MSCRPDSRTMALGLFPRSFLPALALGLLCGALCLGPHGGVLGRPDPTTATSDPASALPGESTSAGLSTSPDSDEMNKLVYFLMQSEYSALAALLLHPAMRPLVSSALKGGRSLTLLAPTDSALETFNSSTCSGLLWHALKHHVLVGRYLGEGMANDPLGTQYPALSGFMVVKQEEKPMKLGLVTASGLSNTAATVQLNAHATRRVVVHWVDSVLSGTCRALPRLSQVPLDPVPRHKTGGTGSLGPQGLGNKHGVGHI